MKKTFFFSLALCSFLHSEIYAEADFKNQLQHKFNYEERTGKYKDFDIPTISKTKEVSLKEHKGIKLEKNQDPQAQLKAKEITNYVNTPAFKKKLEESKNYILNDEQLGYKQELQKQALEKGINNKVTTNTVLSQNEKVYIAISSSMSKELIRNYIRQTYNVRNEVAFILRGTIPNKNQKYGHTKIKPTLDYIRDILDNDGQQLEANIFIDPKTYQKYNIERVPAFLYVSDIMSENPEYFKVYGAVHTKLSIKKTLENISSKNLQKLSNKL